jgi:uncharacterized protein (TIGR04255 family)
MPGRYLKPPLVYMTAHIRTTPVPTLTPEQQIALDQAMIKARLPIKRISQAQEIQFSLTTPDTPFQTRNIPRYGFFSADKRESLILDSGSLEWRTSTYVRYSNLCERVEEVMAALLSAIDVLGYVVSQEVVLTYADVIVPKPERALGDYFERGQNTLPLSLLGANGDQDLQRTGHVQVSRVVAPAERILISLEQLPVSKQGEITRFLPQLMVEPDPTFSMPLQVQPEWQKLTCSHYGILATQAAAVNSFELRDLKIKEVFDPLHVLTRQTFGDLVNDAVCNIDWVHIED